jgi:raffinose/stachyose/melibiose transport system permease protein
VFTFIRKRPFILFILPGILVYTVFITAPIVVSIPFSLTGLTTTGQRIFVGLENYVIVFTNKILFPQFVRALTNTFLGLACNYLVIHPLIIFLAYQMYRKIWGHRVFQNILFIPQFVNAIALTFMVSIFFSPYVGLYYNVFRFLGLEQFGTAGVWTNENMAVVLVVIVWTWAGLGYEMLLYIAGFKMIPNELVEAAIIDGAGEWKRFTRVYFPLLMPTFTNVMVLMFIWTITAFEVPYILGGISGGINGNMDFLALFLYRTAFGSGAYSTNFVGMGSAISTVILAILAAGSGIIMWILRGRQVTY